MTSSYLKELINDFSVSHLCELGLNDFVEVFLDPFLDSEVEKVHVILVVVDHVSQGVLEIILGQIHHVVDRPECDFRLNHPKLRQMTRGVGVFSTEGRAEGVDVREGTAIVLIYFRKIFIINIT